MSCEQLHPFTWSGDTLVARTLLTYVRSVPDHPLKTRIVKRWLRHGYERGMRVRTPGGTRLTVDVHDFIGERIVRDGVYEPKSLARALAIMSGGGVFVDVGANFGLYTCTVGSLAGVRCIAIDACARAFWALQQNVRLNPGVSAALVNAALSSTPGIKGLELPRNDNLGMTRVAGSSGRASEFVGACTLETVLELLGPKDVRLVKIDVEGYELEVLRGLDWSGPFRPAHVLMEFTDDIQTTHQTTRQCLDFLRARDYVAYTIEGAPYGDEPSVLEDNLWLKSATAPD